MYHAGASEDVRTVSRRRRHTRYGVQCRARIQIGFRHYTGYLHNISEGGARLRTITSIGKLGHVVLRLPDLPPLKCSLRWTDAYNAGVIFELKLSEAELHRWIQQRAAFTALNHGPEPHAELFGALPELTTS